MTRKRKTEKQYKKYIATKPDGCDFCAFEIGQPQVRKEYTHFWIVENIFGYAIWDGQDVVEHLMVVPKRHVDSIAHFKAAESRQYLELLAEYEQLGYSVYARAPQNISKSVPHQHTHLIQLGHRKKKALLFVHKPHVMLSV